MLKPAGQTSLVRGNFYHTLNSYVFSWVNVEYFTAIGLVISNVMKNKKKKFRVIGIPLSTLNSKKYISQHFIGNRHGMSPYRKGPG